MQDRQYTISPKSLGGVETDITAILKVFSVIIFIGGFIGGIVLGKQLAGVHNLFVTRYSDEVDFSWGVALLIWLSALLEGSLLLALREVLIVMHIRTGLYRHAACRRSPCYGKHQRHAPAAAATAASV